MKLTTLKFYIPVIFYLALTLLSCQKSGRQQDAVKEEKEANKENISSAGVKESGTELNVQYLLPRKIYKIEKEDLNKDNIKEIMVMSVNKDTAEIYNDYYNFDLLEVFVLDTLKKSYVKILSDTVDYSSGCFFVSLDSGSRKQIVIETNFGGNDEILSRGMFVYDMTAPDKIELIKYFDTGSPSITDLKNNGSKEILVTSLFYGVMPRVNAIPYIKEIFKMENDRLVLKNEEFPDYYDGRIKELLEKYYELKRKVEMGMQPVNMSYPLYREAAEVIVNYYAKGDTKGLQKFWDAEKKSLETNIPQDEYMDLSNFILKALPSAKNA